MAAKKKNYTLPPKNPPPPTPRSSGTAWDVKIFPDSLPGFTGRPGLGFIKPGVNPPTDAPLNPQSPKADFRRWIDYYTETVGYYICILNGLQFNLDEEKNVPPNAVLKMMSDVLDEFATRLHIGDQAISGEHPGNPSILSWPLNNSYVFRFHFQIMSGQLLNDFWVELSLNPTVEPETQMCVNCKTKVRITDVPSKLDSVSTAFGEALNNGGNVVPIIKNPDYISSTSSYLATSSSSHP